MCDAANLFTSRDGLFIILDWEGDVLLCCDVTVSGSCNRKKSRAFGYCNSYNEKVTFVKKKKEEGYSIQISKIF